MSQLNFGHGGGSLFPDSTERAQTRLWLLPHATMYALRGPKIARKFEMALRRGELRSTLGA